MLDRYVAYDTETTGVGHEAKIIDFAAALFVNGVPSGGYSTLINPGDIDWDSHGVKEALSVNGMTRERLLDAPMFGEVWTIIEASLMLAGVRVAHNGEFDERMLDMEARRLSVGTPDMPPTYDVAALDTMLLDFALVPGFLKRKLGLVGQRWLGPLPKLHRAKSDALVCGRVLSAMLTGRTVDNEYRKLPDSIGAIVAMQEKARPEWRAICAKAAAKSAEAAFKETIEI